MRHLNIAALAVTAMLSVSALGGSASAMPFSGLASVATQRADTVEHVSWVCGPYRCWYHPGPYWGRHIGGRTMAIGAGLAGAGAAGVGTAIGASSRS